MQPGENSQSARQMRFTSLAEIAKLEKTLKDLRQGRDRRREGRRSRWSSRRAPTSSTRRNSRTGSTANTALREAFLKLTPGRQRQYHLHFTGAKQSATRESRVEKAIPLILDGMGLNDR